MTMKAASKLNEEFFVGWIKAVALTTAIILVGIGIWILFQYGPPTGD